MTNTLTAYALFTEDGLDQTCYTQKEARREVKDLKAMGCTVKAIQITAMGNTIDEVTDMLNDMCRDKGTAPTASMIAKVSNAFLSATIKVGA